MRWPFRKRQADTSSASPLESLYAQGMAAHLAGDFQAARDRFESVGKKSHGSVVSADLLAGLSAFQLGDVPGAIPHLERVVEADGAMPDALMAAHGPSDQGRLSMEIAIVQGIYVKVELDTRAAALILAEAYQGVGKRDRAISLMSSLLELDPGDEAIRLSLCDLLFEAADFAQCIDTGSVATPETNLGFACHVFKSQAESWLGDWEASRLTLEAALAATHADDETALKAARESLERAYLELGLSPKRLAAFEEALGRRKEPAPTDPGVERAVTYESAPYEPDSGERD